MKKLLTTTFLFLSITLTFSQNSPITLNGKVMHFSDAISDVHILNLNTYQGTISNPEGVFEIYVKLNDTLQFSHIEYTSRKIIMTKDIIEQATYTIFLETMTNYLDIVELRNHKLSGDLTFDTESVFNDSILKSTDYIKELMRLSKLPSFDDYKENLEAPPINNVDPTAGAGVGAGVSIPMKDKANALRRKLRAKKSIPEKIINDLGIVYFVESLKIPEDKIHHFLTYCNFKNIFELYRENKVIEVISILESECIEYLKIKE